MQEVVQLLGQGEEGGIALHGEPPCVQPRPTVVSLQPMQHLGHTATVHRRVHVDEPAAGECFSHAAEGGGQLGGPGGPDHVAQKDGIGAHDVGFLGNR